MENKSALTPLKRFFNLLKVDRQEIFSIYIYSLFNGLLALTLPLGIQAIINLLGAGQVSTSWIVLVVFVIAGVAFTGLLQIMQLNITENLQQKIFARSAFEFAYRIPRLKVEAVNKQYLPELVNRFFDTLSIQKGLSKILLDFSSSTLQVVFGLILLSLYHPFFILFSVFLLLFIFLIFRFTAASGLKSSLTESKYKYEVAHWLEEIARALESFKLAGNSPLPMENTDKVVESYLKARKSHFRTLIIQFAHLVGFKVIVAAGLLLIGGWLVLNQQMNIGQFVASEIIIILVLNSVEKLITSLETIYDVLTAIEKIGHVTDIPLERDNGMRFEEFEAEGMKVEMENLSYRFQDTAQDYLSDINLSIAAGEKICISGKSGSGKSLLMQILSGIYDEISGTIAFNDVPLGNWNKQALYEYTGDNLSKEDIFKGSVMENITFGKRNITFAEVQQISEMVGLTHFIKNLPEGYDTQLLSEGQNLPKTIKLKMMLARCLAGNHKLILLEDHFNQLSYLDKSRFLDYVLSQKWTVIAVSNDPIVAQRFDRTAVLENGKIMAIGTIASFRKTDWFNTIYQTN